MTNNDREINMLIMQEMGLEIGPNNRVYDQDTGTFLTINGMDVVAPGCGSRQVIEFDPHNNRKMMNQLFGLFVQKYSEETDVDVLTYYNVDKENNKGTVECRLSNNDIISSKPYIRDSLKYTDIVIQLNGGEADLDKFDNFDDKAAPAVKKKKSGKK